MAAESGSLRRALRGDDAFLCRYATPAESTAVSVASGRFDESAFSRIEARSREIFLIGFFASRYYCTLSSIIYSSIHFQTRFSSRKKKDEEEERRRRGEHRRVSLSSFQLQLRFDSIIIQVYKDHYRLFTNVKMVMSLPFFSRTRTKETPYSIRHEGPAVNPAENMYDISAD